MLPTGILVRTDLDDLSSSLPGRLIACGPSRLTVEKSPEATGLETVFFLELCQWSDEWCLIEITGPEELAALVVKSVVRHEPVSEVLSSIYRPGAGEYSYALFREGTLLETFESKGPSMETVKFTSELRRVPLQNLLGASDFMIESMNQFGIDTSSRPVTDHRKVRIEVNLPGKRTFWQALLGAASPE
ncbi:MAG: hypothetical protein RRA15_00605 [bacterium]|nr:hypothetical protein [bacterium]MDT8364976.1 hypothetical protein [bacterium]